MEFTGNIIYSAQAWGNGDGYAWTVASGVVLRTLATRGRKRGAPRRQAWGDEAKRKVLWTTRLATTTSTMKIRKPQAQRRGGWIEAEGPKGNTACGHRADHEKRG